MQMLLLKTGTECERRTTRHSLRNILLFTAYVNLNYFAKARILGIHVSSAHWRFDQISERLLKI